MLINSKSMIDNAVSQAVKVKLSGTVSSANSAVKLIMVYDRTTGELIASTTADTDTGEWFIYVPYRQDKSLTVICRDEGEDFNADIYDRISLCTEVMEHTVEYDTIVIPKDDILKACFEASTTGKPSTIPSNVYEHDFKYNIDKIKFDADGIISFVDIDGVEVTVGLTGDRADITSGMEINRITTLVDEDTKQLSRLVNPDVVSDLFSDGSDFITVPFSSNPFIDLSGNHSHVLGYYGGTDNIPGRDGMCTYKHDSESYIEPCFSLEDGEYTFSTWIHVRSFYNSYYSGSLLRQEHVLSVNIKSNGYIYITTGNGKSWNTTRNYNTGSGFWESGWNHITITSSKTELKLYINGVLVGTWSDNGITPDQIGDARSTFTILRSTDYRYGVYGYIHMFRIFNRVLDQSEVDTVFAESTGIVTVDSIYAHEPIDDKLTLIGLQESAMLDELVSIPLAGDWAERILGVTGTVSGVSFTQEHIEFDGTGSLHGLPFSTDTDTGADIGDESDLDIVCRFKSSDLTGKQIIWKSGGSENGVAVGMEYGKCTLYGMSAGTQTTISLPDAIESDKWYRLLCKNDNVVLFEDDGTIVADVQGSVVAGNGNAQVSIGAACDGSPATAGSSGVLEYFTGAISDVEVYQGGTAEVQAGGNLKLAAEIGDTGVQCQVEVEKWDPYNKECIVWVQIPELSSTDDSTIRFYFDENHEDNENASFTGVSPELPVDPDELELRNNADADNVIKYENVSPAPDAPAVPWTPAEDPTVLRWFDNTSHVSDANGISQWSDKTANAGHFIQSDNALKPTVGVGSINGLDTVDFDGTQYLTTTSVPAGLVTILYVQNINDTQYVLFNYTSTSWSTSADSTSSRTDITANFGTPTRQLDGSDVTWSTEADVYSALNNAVHGVAEIGAVFSGWSSISLSGYTAAPSFFITGSIAEIIILPGVASKATIDKYFGYLAWKWGFEANLPADHPYKDAAPTISNLWTPAEITDGHLWLDASDSGTITIGTGVSSWEDKFGVAEPYTQTEGNRQPTITTGPNNLNVVTFDGTDDYLKQSTGIDFVNKSVFFVTKVSSSSPDTANIFGSDVNYQLRFHYSGTTFQVVGAPTTWENALSVPGLTADRWTIFEHNGDASGNSLLVDSVLAGTGGTQSGSLVFKRIGVWSGLTLFLKADIAEIIIVNSSTSQDIKDKIVGYLAHKWGLQDNLPADHSYKDSAPSIDLVSTPVITKPWTPAELPQDLWLDASDPSTITIDTGVSKWYDKSGSGRSMIQTVQSKQPLIVESEQNGLDVLRIDSDDVMEWDGVDVVCSEVINIFAVFKVTGTTTYSSFPITVSSSNKGTPFDAYNSQLCIDLGNAEIPALNYIMSDYIMYHIEVVKDGGGTTIHTVTVTINGTVSTNTSTTSANWNVSGQVIRIGTRQDEVTHFIGDLAEILVLPNLLDSSENGKVEGYLAHKWGLEANLPADHPYKNEAPLVEVATATGSGVMVTIPHTNIGSDLVNFPLTMYLNSSSGTSGLDLSYLFTEFTDHNPYTALLIHSNNADDDATFTDNSVNEATIDAIGTVMHSSSESVFGSSSIRFNGSGYLHVASSKGLDFGTDDFTIDLWFNPDVVTSDDGIFQLNASDSPHFAIAIYESKLFLRVNDASNPSGMPTLTPSTWYHLAVVRNSGVLTFYLNGVSFYSVDVTGVSFSDGGNGAYIGSYSNGSLSLAGYIDEVQILNGTALWNSDFTPLSEMYPSYTAPWSKLIIKQGNTQLYAEVEQWDPIRMEAVLHVRVPVVSSTEDTEIAMWYDGDAADQSAYIGLQGESGVLYHEDSVYDIGSFTNDAAVENDTIRLTTLSTYVTGEYTLTNLDYPANNISISFDLMSGGGTGADYIGLRVDDDNGNYYRVLFDEYHDTVRLLENGTEKVSYAISTLDNNTWRTAVVSIRTRNSKTSIVVTLGGVDIISFTSTSVLLEKISTVQWESYCGAKTNVHYIRNMSISTVPSENVWDPNFIAVYHMSQDPSGTAPQLVDSTSNGYNGTVQGSMTSDDLVYGLKSRAIEFDGVDDRFETATADFSSMQSSYTIEALANFVTATSGYDFLFGFSPSPSGTPQVGGWDNSDNIYIGAAYNDAYATDLDVDRGAYHYFSWLYDGTESTVIRDETLSISSKSFTCSDLSSSQMLIGGPPSNTGNTIIDELRVSNIRRSNDWAVATDLSLLDKVARYARYQPTSNTLVYTVPSNLITEELVEFPVTLVIGPSSGFSNFDTSFVFSSLNTASSWKKLMIKDSNGDTLYSEVELWPEFGSYELRVVKSLGSSNDGTVLPVIVGSPVDHSTYYTFNGVTDGFDDAADANNTNNETLYDVIVEFRPHNKLGGPQVIWKSGGVTNGMAVGIDSFGNIGFWGNNTSNSHISIPAENYEDNVWYKIYCSRSRVMLQEVETGKIVGDMSGTVTVGDGTSDESIACAMWQSPMTLADTGKGVASEFFAGDIKQILLVSVGSITFPTDRVAIIHTKVPVISSTKDTVITVNYSEDNSDQSDYIGLTGSVPAQKVWDSNFAAVYHMSQDPSGGADCILDSTSNQNHGTPSGMSSSDLVQGMVGKALSFGNGKSINCGSDTSLDVIGTVEVSFYNIVGLNNGWGGITSKAAGNSDRQEIYVSTLNDPIFGYNGGGSGSPGCSVDYAGDELWHTMHFTNTGTYQSMYVDGSLEFDTTYTASTSIGADGDFRIGAYLYNGTLNHISGVIDEVRVSSIARSDGWIVATNLSLRDSLFEVSIELGGYVKYLDTWEEAIAVSATIPASSVNSDMVNFKIPFILGTSSGISSYDFSAWFSRMLHLIKFNGTLIKKYNLGGSRGKLGGLHVDNVEFHPNHSRLLQGSIKFGTAENVITLSNAIRNVFLRGDSTISFWIKPEKNVSSNTDVFGTTYSAEIVCYLQSNGVLCIRCGNGSRSYNTATSPGYSVMAGQWTHVVYVKEYSSKKHYMYINGNLVFSGSMNNYITVSSLPFYLGRASYYNNHFNGYLSDLNMYDGAANEDQVLEMYKNENVGVYNNKSVVTIFESTNKEFQFLLGDSVSVNIDGDNLDNTYVAFTVDNSTYNVYVDGAWVQVATKDDSVHGNTGDTGWYYRNADGNWDKSVKDTVHFALSEAFEYPTNRMAVEQVNSSTKEIFGLLFDASSGIFDIAVGMKYSTLGKPVVNKIVFNNKEYFGSEVYDLTEYNGLFTTSKVWWSYRDYDTAFKVFVIKTGDTEWTECTNGAEIPVITNGMDTTNIKMQFKVEFDVIDGVEHENINVEFELI